MRTPVMRRRWLRCGRDRGKSRFTLAFDLERRVEWQGGLAYSSCEKSWCYCETYQVDKKVIVIERILPGLGSTNIANNFESL